MDYINPTIFLQTSLSLIVAFFITLGFVFLRQFNPKISLLMAICISLVGLSIALLAKYFLVSFLVSLWIIYVVKNIIWDKDQEEFIRLTIKEVILEEVKKSKNNVS